ncbi:MAG: methyltransferase domain-containing protein [Proteobacteria bacterium]|nr:methyltransferase domain-containing protein [Pseudomonadota bacterium]
MKFPLAMLLAFSTGFIYLSYEILWIRIFTIATKSHPIMFGMVVGFYLLGLGLGAFYFRRFTKETPLRINQLLQLLLSISAILCYIVIPGTALLSSIWFYASKYGLGLLVIATFSFGGIFPLLARASIEDENNVGREVSYIYGANILGATLGSLVTGYIFLDHFSIGIISSFLAVFCLILSLVISNFSGTAGSKSKNLIWGVLILGILVTSGPFHQHLYKKLKYMARSKKLPPFERVIENRNGVIAVTKFKFVFGNGAYDGVISTSLSPKPNPEIQTAYLAFLLKPDARDILEIGLASGSWAQVLVHGPKVESLTSIEINPGYLELIAEYDAVKSLLKNPKFTVHIDDGRRWLNINKDSKFDLIIMNSTFHWRNHATNLLSIENLSLVKQHLNPGGVAIIGTTHSKSAMKTVATAFSNVKKYHVYMIASDSPIQAHRERYKEILQDFKIAGTKVLNLERAKDQKRYQNLVGQKFGGSKAFFLKKFREVEIITDDNMTTEFNVLKNWIKRR